MCFEVFNSSNRFLLNSEPNARRGDAVGKQRDAEWQNALHFRRCG
jgi:hypothetical protein